ncbi:MAG: glycoside hydrolase family 127 protein [Alphaproteobacteria bacterium]|nr:glycoside hydrolase family 127 protein [Alphaproteobacteria bacterium]
MRSRILEPNRRALLESAAIGAALAFVGSPVLAANLPISAEPVPLKNVRLRPSPYLAAVESNLKYLLSLSADRFLHNYCKFAGLPVNGASYGGWESETIAGEGAGHYLSALSLMHAQTGDTECKRRIDYIVSVLTRVQKARGDGYCAGFMRKRKDGTIVDGKEIFAEITAGDIASGSFDLNGAWSPLYNVHKIFAGLLDANALADSDEALAIAVGFAGFIDKVFAALNDDQVQQVLACEYGGLNESFAELYARTGSRRWLRLSERIYDNRSLDPVINGEDVLANTHANTQIPKIVGMARLSEVGGRARPYAAGSRFFWERVAHHHSFVIGGNGDREYFFEPDTVAQHISEQTCEHCASYNMLKLTRHLFGRSPDGALFDYYERTHLNHILAAHNPATGVFTYMTPMMSGAKREYSTPNDDFWCCVLTGMESHSKHGDSIFWQSRDTLFVNLYIPSTVAWHHGATLEIDTRYPYEGHVGLRLARLVRPKRFGVALRIPAWAQGASVAVNGEPVTAGPQRGYVLIHRKWRAGDLVTLDLPLRLRLESPSGDDKVVAVLRGSMVMAADLAPADKPFDGVAPALVGEDLLAGFAPVSVADGIYRSTGIARPADLIFKPFYAQYDRRCAIYFNRYSESGWKAAQAAYMAEQARLNDLAARSLDVMHLGDVPAERDHNLQSTLSYPVVYRGRNGRDARWGGYLAFDMKATRDGGSAGPLALGVTYWGSEVNRDFTISVDGTVIATVTLTGSRPGTWIDVEYPIPEVLAKSKQKITVRFDPKNGKTAGPVFGVRLYTLSSAS